MTKDEAFDYLVNLIAEQNILDLIYEKSRDERLDYMAASLVQIDTVATVLKEAVKRGEKVQDD